MSTTIADLLVKVGVSQEGANKVQQELDKVGAKGKEAGEKTKEGADEGSAAMKEMGRIAGRLGTIFKTVGGGIKTALTTAFKAGVAGAAAATAAATALFLSTAEKSKELLREATTIGTDVEGLQRLQYAAKQTGAESENLTEGLKTLRENLGEAVRLGSGPAIDSLGSLGIKLEEIKDLNAQEQLELLGDALKALPSDAERLSVAIELLGTDGAALLPLFEQGTEGIRMLADQADEYGAVMSESATKASAEAGKTLENLLTTISGVAREILVEAAPAIKEIAGQIREWVGENKDLIGQRVDQTIQVLVDLGKALIEVIGTLVEWFSDFDGQTTLLIASLGALALVLGGLPGLVIGLGTAFGLALADVLGFTEAIKKARQETAALEEQAKRDKRAETAVRKGFGMSERELASLSTDEYEQEIEAILASTTLSASQRDQAVANLDKKRARGQKKLKNEREMAVIEGGVGTPELFALAEKQREQQRWAKRRNKFQRDALAAAAGGGGKKDKKEKDVTSDVTFAQALMDIRSNQSNPEQLKLVLQRLSKSTPSTKDIKPTVAIDFFNFNVTQHITGVSDPVQAAEMSNQMLVKFFKSKTAKAGQALTSNVVR